MNKEPIQQTPDSDREVRKPSGRFPRWADLTLIVLVVLVSVVLIELGVRLALPSLDGREMSEFDPELGSVLRPGFDGVAQGVHVRINSHGLRSPEIPLEKPDGVFRILVLGDSWTFGVCIPQDQTYPAHLERILRDRFPGREIQVINSGVSGYETYNEAVYFRRAGYRFDPDIVLIGYYPVNDVHDKKAKFERRAREREAFPLLYSVLRFPKTHLHSYQYFQYFRSQLKDAVLEWWTGEPPFNAGPEELDDHYKVEWTSLYREDFSGWQVARESLEDIGSLSREIGAKTLLAVFPDLRSLRHYRLSLRDKFFPQLEQAAARAKIPVVDVFPAFAPYEDREEEVVLWERKGSTHPNEKGYAAIAELLAEHLIDRGFLDSLQTEPVESQSENGV